MNNRKLSKIITLYTEGVSVEVCIAIIMDLTKNSTAIAKGTWIHKFYEEVNKKIRENYGKSMIIKGDKS